MLLHLNILFKRQDGAFIVCGLFEEAMTQNNTNQIMRMRIDDKEGRMILCIVKNKKNIMHELDSLIVNRAYVYPEIDDVAYYIKQNIVNV